MSSKSYSTKTQDFKLQFLATEVHDLKQQALEKEVQERGKGAVFPTHVSRRTDIMVQEWHDLKCHALGRKVLDLQELELKIQTLGDDLQDVEEIRDLKIQFLEEKLQSLKSKYLKYELRDLKFLAMMKDYFHEHALDDQLNR
jgi:hypothetical protein